MKTTTNFKWLTLTCLLVMVSVTSCKEETAQTQKSATVEELGQMNRDFAKALLAGDAEAAANLYDENASLLPPNEPMVTGRENIRAYWQAGIDAGIVGATVKTISASSDGDLGYEIGTFELQIKAEDGSIIIDKGKYTEILQRNAEGKWMSLYGMWSNNE
jgi:ketosteroid isomerase-like protein